MGVKECCGNCKYNTVEWKGVYITHNISFYCGNENSTEYGSPTFYDDSCDDYEEKE